MNFALTTWAATVALMAVLAIVAGRRTGKQWFSIFIDQRRTWSLTQFQLVCWTFAVLPVIVAFAVARAVDDPATAWSFTVPAEVWAVMGISIGSSVIGVSVKSQKDRDPSEGGLAAGQRIAVREGKPRAGDFFDMVALDEGKNALKAMDLTKFQNLVLTLALVVTFVWSALQVLSSTDLSAVPALNEAVVGILGISHAGYLAGKAVPQNGEPALSVAGVRAAGASDAGPPAVISAAKEFAIHNPTPTLDLDATATAPTNTHDR